MYDIFNQVIASIAYPKYLFDNNFKFNIRVSLDSVQAKERPDLYEHHTP